jgi:hypothetical protein
MSWPYGVKIGFAAAPFREKARCRVAGQVMGQGAETPPKRCENDLGRWRHVRNTRMNHVRGGSGLQTAKDDDRWHDLGDFAAIFANKFVCLGWDLNASKLLKLKLT